MTRFRLLNWWVSKIWTGWHLFFGICGIAVCFIGSLTGVSEMTRCGTWGIGMLVIIHMLHAVLHQMDAYLNTLESVDRVPVFQMKQVTGFYLLLFLLAFILLAWLGNYLPWKVAGNLISGYLIAVIRWLVGLFFHGEQAPTEQVDAKPEHGGALTLPLEETSMFAIWMDRVLIAVFWIAAFAAFIVLYHRLVRRLLHWLSTLHFDGDEKRFLKLEQDQKERLGADQRSGVLGRRISGVMDRSINGSIRRQYRKEVRKRLSEDQKPALSCLTPEETELLAGFEKNNKARIRMHEIYEKARYSKQGCERSELEEMKKMR